MPVALLRQYICCIETGFLNNIGVHTPTVAWASFLVLLGIVLGMGITASHIAIQAVMERYIILYIDISDLARKNFPSHNDMFLANSEYNLAATLRTLSQTNSFKASIHFVSQLGG